MPANILQYILNMVALTDYLELIVHVSYGCSKTLGQVVQKPINDNPGLKVDQSIKFYCNTL